MSMIGFGENTMFLNWFNSFSVLMQDQEEARGGAGPIHESPEVADLQRVSIGGVCSLHSELLSDMRKQAAGLNVNDRDSGKCYA